MLSKFINTTLLNYQEDVLWDGSFRGASLPACQRQLMLSDFYKNQITVPQSFEDQYQAEVGRSIHRLVQATWAKQSLLWGDWKCLDREHCGVFFQNTLLEKGKCIRCGHKAEYVEKIIKHEDSGFSGKCHGVVWCAELNGYLVLKLKSRNHNVIREFGGKLPYASDCYQAAAYATLLYRQYKLPIAGRLVLWIGKPKPSPFLSWFYPGLGEDLFDSEVEERVKSLKLIEQGKILEVPGKCLGISDNRSCVFHPICFSGRRDALIQEAFVDRKVI